MRIEEAVLLLKCHAFVHDDLDHPKMESGFLGSLRPFRGQLIEENFHELMEIVRTLAPQLKQQALNREVMSCLWSITHLGRAWAILPDGMLRRNKLLSDEQIALMEEWLDLLSYAVMILIEDGGEEEAFWGYKEYVREQAENGEKGRRL
ncbi:hypothetical protein [Paenibacillus sp. 7516]|uniref:hypothetical protein n=1 Tax=Paenibacillus sp. 7516 TaxID=2022549 RepID=UPI000BA5F6D0|nr:hypothetical protein [Paenibacillus sp. 7516]PAF28665.1 hypothetical protein CHI14_25830 [Paenibacillus sp. 7516]